VQTRVLLFAESRREFGADADGCVSSGAGSGRTGYARLHPGESKRALMVELAMRPIGIRRGQ